MNVKTVFGVLILGIAAFGAIACYDLDSPNRNDYPREITDPHLRDTLGDTGQPTSTDPELSTDEPLCVEGHCNGRGTCEVLDEQLICRCEGNWDEATMCAQCLDGYTLESDCIACDAGYMEMEGKCYEACADEFCNSRGKCYWNLSGARICLDCNGGLTEASLCYECPLGREWHDSTSMCVESCSASFCGDAGICALTESGERVCICESGFGDPSCGTNIPELIWLEIEGGTFSMGSVDGAAATDEGPVHDVVVLNFEMLKTEVTVSQYRECVIASVCSAPEEGNNQNWETPGHEGHPVNYVSWSQARTFCEWIGAQLPSEAQWEYAAKGGNLSREFPWGNETASCDYAVMNDPTDGTGCGVGRTMASCSKEDGNSYDGLCDMAGNVWEWAEDDYHESYDGAPTSGENAWVDTPTRNDFRVKRGGAYHNDVQSLRSSKRASGLASDQTRGTGFRCAR